MLAALFATSVTALATSAGLVGTGDPGKRVADVPELSRTLVQHAIVETPEWQHAPSLAYARRADELLRLRDLPTTPARAVVEYAERARTETTGSTPPAEISGASTHPAADSLAVASAAADVPVATGSAAPGSVEATVPAPYAPAVSATLQPATLASRLSDAPPPDAQASDAKPSDAKPSDAKPSDAKPSDAKPSDAKPSDAKPADAKATQHAEDASQIAAIESGPEATESAKAPERKLTARGRVGIKARIRRPVRILAPRTIPPQARTGFPIAAPPDPPNPAVPTHAVAAAAKPTPPALNIEPVPDTRIDAGR
jgi:hypothetical protein